ncbi:uncharacterized protein DUF4192 [Isoptericola sp. CG 20/1183]|uniref:Uncharacterized protein DUF4192 n=1 Tax=Isoptericola halotolerans TaxID=300560 RepID=A0ABX5EEK4_9MICO|nr:MULTISPECIES: DUF4192 domain-containing protein [Isoptericola]PRZ03881.1 uncharacterized protein DUF4192 [Isoptericola sp. CG 20/1183]PRZ03986.1 uncharacterized protein DUF4192 [Isoptericola halotolerans]
MTTSLDLPEPSTIPLRSPHDVLAAIPYRLGFRPAESIVIACTAERGRPGLVARVGIDELRGAGAADGLAALARAVAGTRPTYCALVLYTAGGAAAAADVVEDVRRALDPVVETDGWLVTPDGYRGLGCEDPTCCPEPGHPLAALESGEIGAAYVLAGHVVAESADAAYRIPRAAEETRNLAGRAARRSEIARGRAQEGAATRRWRDDALDAWREALRRVEVGADAAADEVPAPLPAALVGRVGAALADRVVRDVALLTLVPGGEEAARETTRATDPVQIDDATGKVLGRVVDPSDAVAPDPDLVARARAVLEQVDAQVPRRLRAPALTLLAFLAWWAGDGPRASYRVTEALEADPSYRLAQLLHCVVAAALPPGWVRAASGG